jgi:hypothetical protein
MDVTVNRVPGTYFVDLFKNENVVLKFLNSAGSAQLYI